MDGGYPPPPLPRQWKIPRIHYLSKQIISFQTVINGLKHEKVQYNISPIMTTTLPPPRHTKSTFTLKMSRITLTFVAFHNVVNHAHFN